MCSINGIIYTKKAPESLKKDIRGMVDTTAYRGPDDTEVIVFPEAVLTFNRLAIIAPREKHSIQKDEAADRFASFNGEIVNHKSLRVGLERDSVHGEADSALILPLYEKFGSAFVKKLAGMFAIALYDRRAHELHLWRDPLGIKPLYYYRDAERVIFSSEIKAIYATLKPKPPISFSALDHILRYRFNSGRKTVFPTIMRVLPGEHVVFSEGNEKHEQFWTLTDNASEEHKRTPEEGRDLFERVIREHMQADVRGGVFVSGGLDSSLLAAFVARDPGSPYAEMITLAFDPVPADDEQYTDILEEDLKTPFERVRITAERARDTLSSSIRFFDEPLENPIHVGTFLMAERAHELGIKSVLTGDGSDELFLGYERHAPWIIESREQASKEYDAFLQNMKLAESEELYHPGLAAYTTSMTNNDGVLVQEFTASEAFRFERWERLQEYHCMRLDRMTMAHSVEARVPFLDHRIAEYSLGFTTRTLYGASGKSWLKKIAEPYLPQAILLREKVRFPYFPNQWLSGEGVAWTREILLDPRAKTGGVFRRDAVEKYIAEHENGGKRGRLLWALITLELWLNEYARNSSIQ